MQSKTCNTQEDELVLFHSYICLLLLLLSVVVVVVVVVVVKE